MNNLSPQAYRALFLKHLSRFLENMASGKELKRSHAVAVSGGIDSMTLLWAAVRLHRQGTLGPIRAIFIHHHTRPGQDLDLEIVKKLCRDSQIPLSILHAEGLRSSSGNFEAKARRARQELCLNELKKGEFLWTGHHLDDSYEWSFMQRHRSTTPQASIGIPVRNGRIIRPFLCVTRAQIKRLARFEDIPYRDDPTNNEIKHDRNFIRLKVAPLIRQRYPKYLKFYAHFANYLAMMMNVSLLKRSGPSKIFVYEEGAIFLGRSFSELQIQEMIHHFSNTDRGEIITTIERMLRAIDNGKKGPFHFSGGIEASYSHGLLMLYRQGMINNDHLIAASLSKLSNEDLLDIDSYDKAELEQAWQNLVRKKNAMRNMPGLVLVMESESICKTLNTSVYDSRFPRVSALCKERGLRFMTFQKCLDVWMQKKERLPERLKIIPLDNLSHLFTSQ